jgi:uncharacterized protein
LIYYIDTSAFLKLILEEAESAALTKSVNTACGEGHTLISSVLLETELYRAAWCLGVDRAVIAREISKVTLVSASDATFRQAGDFDEPHLRSLDALHLATALESGATGMYAYDKRLIEAAKRRGIKTLHV